MECFLYMFFSFIFAHGLISLIHVRQQEHTDLVWIGEVWRKVGNQFKHGCQIHLIAGTQGIASDVLDGFKPIYVSNEILHANASYSYGLCGRNELWMLYDGIFKLAMHRVVRSNCDPAYDPNGKTDKNRCAEECSVEFQSGVCHVRFRFSLRSVQQSRHVRMLHGDVALPPLTRCVL